MFFFICLTGLVWMAWLCRVFSRASPLCLAASSWSLGLCYSWSRSNPPEPTEPRISDLAAGFSFPSLPGSGRIPFRRAWDVRPARLRLPCALATHGSVELAQWCVGPWYNDAGDVRADCSGNDVRSVCGLMVAGGMDEWVGEGMGWSGAWMGIWRLYE